MLWKKVEYFSGNHDELLEKSNEYKNFYEKQIQK